MARKNARISDNYESGVLFDTCTKAVMAHVSTDGIKEKVQSVREVVPGRSNNDIVLVLQYYDYSVEQTIQAFLETGAKEALGEWHVPGNKPNNKKKKSKSKRGSSASSSNGAAVNQNSSAVPPDSKSQDSATTTTTTTTTMKAATTAVSSAPPSKLNVPSSVNTSSNSVDANTNRNNALVNGQPSGSQVNSVSSAASSDTATFQASSSMSSSVSTIPATTGHRSSAPSTQGTSHQPTASRSAATTMPAPVGAGSAPPTSQGAPVSAMQHQMQHPKPKATDAHISGHNSGSRDRTNSERSTASNISIASSTATGAEKPRRPHAGLEKSLKDLQRQTVSLQRLKHVIETELEKSSRTITEFFEQIRQRVNEREQTMISQLATVKTEAYNTLDKRQQQAVDLRQSTIRAQTMTDQELADLRADIKVFAGDRKIDEELGSTTRFVGDIDHITKEIENFGTVVPVKNSYNQRRQATPVESVTVPPGVQRPSVPLSQSRSQPSVTTERTALHNTTTPQPGSNQTHPLAGKVISQSESVTKYEITELQNQPNSNSTHDSMFRRRVRPGPYIGGRGGGYAQGNWRGGRRGGIGRGGDRYSGPPPEMLEPPSSVMEGDAERNQSKKSRRRQKKREGEREQRRQLGKPGEERRGSAGGQWSDSAASQPRPRQQVAPAANHVARMNGGLMPQHHESNGGDGLDREQSHRGQEHGGSKPQVNGSHYHTAVPHREADMLPAEKPPRPALETTTGCIGATESRRPNAQSLGSGDNGIIPLAVRDGENNNKYNVGGPTRATVSVQGGKVVHDSVYTHQEGLPQRESRKRSRIVKNPEDIPVVNGDAKMNGVD